MPYEVFKAADAYLTLGVANNGLWKQCCAALNAQGDPQAKECRIYVDLTPLYAP